MTGIMLIIAILLPVKWSIRMVPINTPSSCWTAHLLRVRACEIEFPEATSIQRAVCEANSAGQYTSCIEGIP